MADKMESTEYWEKLPTLLCEKGEKVNVTIDIPKEFEEHWKNDRFEDSLNRLKADAHCLAGNYEKETIDMLIVAFKGAEEE